VSSHTRGQHALLHQAFPSRSSPANPPLAPLRCNPPVNVAQLPLAGVATVYGVIGDSLVYLCAVVGGWVVAMARRRRV